MNSTFLILILATVAAIAVLLAQRARLSLLTVFFIALPYPLAINGGGHQGNVCAADVLIGIGLVTLLGRSRLRLGAAGQAVIAFLIVATTSSLLASPPEEIALGLGRMVLVTLAPLLIFANMSDPVRELRQGLTAYCLSTAVLAGFSFFAFATHGIGASMHVLGINKNSQGPIFGTAVAITFAAITAKTFRTQRAVMYAYGVLAACSVGLLLCLSRGGWVGTGCGLMVVIWCTGRIRTAVYGSIILVPVIAAIWSVLPAKKIAYATNISPNSYVLRTRFESMHIVMESFEANPILGVGIGLERKVEPHDVLILALGETGIAGLITFLLMVGMGAATLVKAMRRFPKNDPARALMVAALAGFAVYHVQTLIDVYWRRGVGALSWACVGTAVALTATQLRQRRRHALTSAVHRPRKIAAQAAE